MSAVVFGAHSVNPTGCVSKRGYSLAVWAVALLPYFVLVCGDNSFTFQSAYFCLALMVFAAFLLEREGCVFLVMRSVLLLRTL